MENEKCDLHGQVGPLKWMVARAGLTEVKRERATRIYFLALLQYQAIEKAFITNILILAVNL